MGRDERRSEEDERVVGDGGWVWTEEDVREGEWGARSAEYLYGRAWHQWCGEGEAEPTVFPRPPPRPPVSSSFTPSRASHKVHPTLSVAGGESNGRNASARVRGGRIDILMFYLQ